MSKIETFEPEMFKTFWEEVWRPHMRHTDGRGDAREAYRKALLRGALPEDIIDGARGFIRCMPEKDKPYIPLAATWLGKESYEAWVGREREYQARLSQAKEAAITPPKPITNYRPAFLQVYEGQKRHG